MSIHLSVRLGALGLTAVFALAACGGEAATPTPAPSPTPEPTPTLAPTPAAAEVIVVNASEFKYEPTDITISASEPATIELVNAGIVEHDFTIDITGGEQFQVAVKVGETTQGTITGLEAGVYEFYCTVPGHKAAGMVGSLTVEP